MYECLRCGYLSNRKYNLITHLKRKTPCSVIYLDVDCSVLLDELCSKTTPNRISKEKVIHPSSNCHPDVIQTSSNTHTHTKNTTNSKIHNKDKDDNLYYCRYCDKPFKYRQGRFKHEKSRCNVAKLNVMKLSNLENEVQTLKKKLDNTTHTTSVMSINHNTNSNNTINNIHVHGVGSENIQYLAPFIQKNLRDFSTRKPRFFYDYMKEKHFNLEHPENHNLKCTNKKLKEIKMWSDKSSTFETRQKDDATLILYKVIVDDVGKILSDLIAKKNRKQYKTIMQKTLPYIQNVLAEYEYDEHDTNGFTSGIQQLKRSLKEIYTAIYDGTTRNQLLNQPYDDKNDN